MKTTSHFQSQIMIAVLLVSSVMDAQQPTPPQQASAQRPPPPGTPPAQSQDVHLSSPLEKAPALRPPPPPPPPPTGGQPIGGPPGLGQPLAGLTQAQLADFRNGVRAFTEVETIKSGLGPIFNNVSCVACHRAPAPGGASPINVTRFGRVVNGVFDPLADEGGSLLQENAISPDCREVVPADANVVAHRNTTPLFGAGLIEAIPDSAIAALAAQAKPDGVKGRVSMITDVVSKKKRVGHFGWKGQQATLLAFAADAYLNEMGITNRFFPTENAPNGDVVLLEQFDHVADIEDKVDPVTGKSGIDRQADFMRLLAPPPQQPLSPSAMAGSMVFSQTGCAVCHTPVMVSGTSPIAALSKQQVHLYSDLLLHDMSTLSDGIAQADAGMKEIRTPPLWGLRASAPWLHDGRARTIDAAIRAHDGEAKVSRDRYIKLTPQAQQQLIDFLLSL